MASAPHGRTAGKSRELMGLAAASLACVLVVGAGVASGGMLPFRLLGSQTMATAALIGGIALLAGVIGLDEYLALANRE